MTACQHGRARQSRAATEMIRRLIVTPQAEAELLDAAQWYEDRRAGLSADFLLHLEATFDAIQRRPKLTGHPRRFGHSKASRLHTRSVEAYGGTMTSLVESRAFDERAEALKPYVPRLMIEWVRETPLASYRADGPGQYEPAAVTPPGWPD